MGWEIPKTSFYAAKPPFTTSSSGRSEEGTASPAYDLTGKKSEPKNYAEGIRASVNQRNAEYRQELEGRVEAKQQEQAQMTEVRNKLKKQMDEIRAERSRVKDPVYDHQKMEELDAQESKAKSDDRLAYFQMGNNYQSIISTTLQEGNIP
jgi:hypothetical protein